MTDISVVILVGNEERHIGRCLEKLAALAPRQVFVVESQHGDRTHEVVVETARRMGWEPCRGGERVEREDVGCRCRGSEGEEKGEPCRNGERVEREGVGCRCRGSEGEAKGEPCRNGERVEKKEISAGGIEDFSTRSTTLHGSSFERSSRNVECVEGEKIELQTVFHTWPGLQAKQFNWAIDNLPIVGEWVLRLDADEYLTDETVERMREELGVMGEKLENGVGVGGGKKVEKVGGDGEGKTVLAYTLELKRKFCGGEIRHATIGIRQVRLFRRGCARYDEGLMDERLVVDSSKFEVGSSKYEVGGSTRSPASQLQTSNFKLQTPPCITDFEGAFYDDSLMPMDEWREKHRGYAKREAAQAIESLKTGVWTDPRKASYYKLPRYFRAFAYFCIRYFLKGGILDGYAGWMWNFWQGLWYRWLVDKEIARMGK